MHQRNFIERFINYLSIYDTMRQLNITFEDSEFESIKNLKEELEYDWRKFIICVVDYARDSIKKGHLKI